MKTRVATFCIVAFLPFTSHFVSDSTAAVPAVPRAIKEQTKPTPATSCSIRRSGNQAVFNVSIVERGGRLVLDETTTLVFPPLHQGVRTFASDITIVLNGATSLQESSTGMLSDAGSLSGSTSSIKYGRGFRGIREADVSSDGKTVSGTVDGRAIVAFSVPAASSARARKHLRTTRLKFADGAPAPVLEANASTQRAIAHILKRARRAGAKCLSSEQGSSAQPDQSGCQTCEGCQTCRDNCYTKFSGLIGCGAATVATCAETFGLGCVVGGVACEEALSKCIDDCNSSSDCCAVKCPSGGCCPKGDTCAVIAPNDNIGEAYASTCCEVPPDSFSPGSCSPSFDPQPASYCGGICCPQGHGVACGGLCCSACCSGKCCFGSQCSTENTCCPSLPGGPTVPVSCGDVCCQDPTAACSTENKCCPGVPGRPTPLSCGGNCCPGANDVCVGSVCCPSNAPVCGDGSCCPQSEGVCVGNTCCGAPRGGSVCGQSCCGLGETCCGGTCCNTNSTCLNDGPGSYFCCPKAQVCGLFTCCGADQVCTDPANGTCAQCPTGLVACQRVGGGPVICCAPGESCCAGGPGTPPMCCTDPNQQACCGNPDVCHDGSFCIR